MPAPRKVRRSDVKYAACCIATDGRRIESQNIRRQAVARQVAAPVRGEGQYLRIAPGRGGEEGIVGGRRDALRAQPDLDFAEAGEADLRYPHDRDRLSLPRLRRIGEE